jgi:esterase/lipase superfamily enzyme
MLSLSSCKLLAELAPTKEDTSKIKDWLVIPVYYATTRKRAAGAALDYLEQRSEKHSLQFGVKNVLIPRPALIEISDETIQRMGWIRIHLDTPLPNGKRPAFPPAENCTIKDCELSNRDMVSQFDKYRAASGSKKVIFFAHGCCATFTASLERSAKIAASMQVPLVVFDWNSPRGFTKYLENETTALQSYDAFYAFLNAVEQYVPASDTILLGHSMGAHFVDNALVRRSVRNDFKISTPKYSEVIFCEPDIDARAYINHNTKVSALAEKIRIYFNADDGRLDASATAHGGFERLGRPGVLMPTLNSIPNQYMIDITDCSLGHEIPFFVVPGFSFERRNSLQELGYESQAQNPNYMIIRRLGSYKTK